MQSSTMNEKPTIRKRVCISSYALTSGTVKRLPLLLCLILIATCQRRCHHVSAAFIPHHPTSVPLARTVKRVPSSTTAASNRTTPRFLVPLHKYPEIFFPDSVEPIGPTKEQVNNDDTPESCYTLGL